ncbi:MAG: DNA-3-methyladenine glycosylase [Bdellovibrionales bacterium]|nr:DNA-3-methyladenine glycosylase [Bdellovibrionales bacterium]
MLSAEFFERSTKKVAQELLGKLLIRKYRGKELVARIVETEAYLGITDPGCHTYNGRRTKRTETMYLDGGHIYIYMIYGMYHCLNFVTRDQKSPEAVLIRAAEPIQGFKTTQNLKLLSGPGKLCREMKIDKKLNGLYLDPSQLYLIDDGFKVNKRETLSLPRVGIPYAGEAQYWPLRFAVKNHSAVSKL